MAEIYDTDRFAELFANSQNPSRDSLGLASRYMVALLSKHGIHTALAGGRALNLRGSPRRTRDVDLAVKLDMKALKAIIVIDPRLCFPQTHGERSVTIFVHTGGDWDHGYPEQPIWVDLIIAGNLGTPQSLPAGSEEINAVASPHGTPARVIDLYHQFAVKLRVVCERRDEKDYSDVQFLFYNYHQALSQIHSRFKDHLQYYYSLFVQREPQQWSSYMKLIFELD